MPNRYRKSTKDELRIYVKGVFIMYLIPLFVAAVLNFFLTNKQLAVVVGVTFILSLIFAIWYMNTENKKAVQSYYE